MTRGGKIQKPAPKKCPPHHFVIESDRTHVTSRGMVRVIKEKCRDCGQTNTR